MRQEPTPKGRAKRALVGTLAVLLAGTAVPNAALAQASPVDALTQHLTTLDSDPRNFDALVGAGDAALAIGDLPSAAAFFGRAAEVRPDDPKALIGQGSVAVQMNEPERAMQYFAAAAGRGGSVVQMGAGRGLAHDLLGRTREAESDYRAAMQGPWADTARRRLALNLAMGGDRTAAMAILNPLVRQGDPAALRARAFVLALTGDTDNARRAIEAAMPGSGDAIDPFLRRLPQLSASEKAAAVHLGLFPTSAGQSARAAQPAPAPAPTRVAQAQPQRTPQPAATANPNPPVDPRGSVVETQERSDDRRASAGSYETNGPVTYNRVRDNMTRRDERYGNTGSVEVVEAAPTPPPPAPRPVLRVSQPVAQPATQPVAQPETRAEPPSEERLASIATALRNAPRSTRAATPPPAPQPKFEPPPAPRPVIERPRPAAQAAPAPAPAKPDIGVEGRWFVQLAGSDNRGAMSYEWRRIKRKALSTLSKHDPLLTQGVDFHRLLVGPFDGRSEAQALVNSLKAEGVDSYAWQRSPAALRIDPL